MGARNRGPAGRAKRQRVIVAHLDDMYEVPPPEGVRLMIHINIQIRKGKTHVWNAAGEGGPPHLNNLGVNV